MKFVVYLLPFVLLVAGCQSPEAIRRANASADANANQPAIKQFPSHPRHTPVLYIVGDSTVHNTAPRITGWGDVVSNYFDNARISVVNCARPGRSSRTFISQGWWQQILAAAKPGDFVIIQMGHNDSSPINDTNRSRGTLPGIGDAETNVVNGVTHQPETVHTYGWYLTQYITDARAKGMTPILCTPVSRLVPPGKEADTTRYAAWARAIAMTEYVPLIDLNRRALDRWQGKTTDELKTEYFSPKDNTHFNRAGAELNAACVVDGIRALDDCPLTGFLQEKP
jgi:lysophospholipase L1-like esterase